jgi:hypothetical protein
MGSIDFTYTHADNLVRLKDNRPAPVLDGRFVAKALNSG